MRDMPDQFIPAQSRHRADRHFHKLDQPPQPTIFIASVALTVLSAITRKAPSPPALKFIEHREVRLPLAGRDESRIWGASW